MTNAPDPKTEGAADQPQRSRPREERRGLTTEHDATMARLAREIAWLEHHEHWWLRELRWRQTGVVT